MDVLLIFVLLTSAAAGPVPAAQDLNQGRQTSTGRYRNLEEWKNPFIVVHADGFELLPREGSRTTTRLTVHELEDLLLSLPASSWVQGRVVAVQENCPRSRDDDQLIRTNRTLLGIILAENDIEEDWVPSA